jgi:ABC-type Mn2+/Zn2+ transport system ATPase subunit
MPLDRKRHLIAIDPMDSPKIALISDANHPLISSCLKDEMLLYHIDTQSEALLLESFERLSGKSIDSDHDLSKLSGGQKVLLMLCLALQSPAKSIIFKDLRHSLDAQKWGLTKRMIDESDKDISLGSDA